MKQEYKYHYKKERIKDKKPYQNEKVILSFRYSKTENKRTMLVICLPTRIPQFYGTK